MSEKELPVEKVEAGMELASDIVNKYNEVLISKGSAFEEKHKFLLKTWGIKNIKIKLEDRKNEDLPFSEK